MKVNSSFNFFFTSRVAYLSWAESNTLYIFHDALFIPHLYPWWAESLPRDAQRTLTFEGADSLHRGVVVTSAFKVLIPFSIAIVFEVLIPLLSYPSSLFEVLSPLRSRFPPWVPLTSKSFYSRGIDSSSSLSPSKVDFLFEVLVRCPDSLFKALWPRGPDSLLETDFCLAHSHSPFSGASPR